MNVENFEKRPRIKQHQTAENNDNQIICNVIFLRERKR